MLFSESPIATLPKDKNRWKEKFSEKLREQMQKQNISKYDLSDKTGFTSMSIYYYMSGKNIPSAFAVARIAKALNCSVNDLMDFE